MISLVLYIDTHLLFSVKERALEYLSTCIDQVNTFGDILQLVIVELIYKVFLMFSFLCFFVRGFVNVY